MTADIQNDADGAAGPGAPARAPNKNDFTLTEEEKAHKAVQDRALLDKAIQEQRASARKAFKMKVMVAFEDAPAAPAITVDIGTGGLCLKNLPRQLKNGQRLRVSGELMVQGASHRLVVICKVTHCVFSGEGFKAGVQFLDLDPALIPVIQRIVNS